jgi:peptidoglycan/xylan/chitin deacetylase (PgdA/CDA1 family)
MRLFSRRLRGIAVGIVLSVSFLSAAEPAVPILVYHRVGPVRSDSMTVTIDHFREQVALLAKNHFSVIPITEFVVWRLGKGPAPPPRSVVLSFDDGHMSVYREARSIVTANRIPVTLFIYPSCISRASYCMTWEELSEMTASPLFTIASHTFWHPNFKHEAKKLDRDAYARFADTQLGRSRLVLEARLHQPVNLLAWPFGIYDSYLMNRASAAGYVAAFSIECRAATASDPIMSLPRCLISDEETGPRFLRFLDSVIRSARN